MFTDVDPDAYPDRPVLFLPGSDRTETAELPVGDGFGFIRFYRHLTHLPFRFYGNHVSLFCLLMTATNIIYMIMNNKNQPQNDQMKGMQTMMYIMPIMFLFIFNSYSSGLSYYYFIATLITILQTWIIRKFVDDQKLLKQIELAKSKPVKKSKFQQRLEEMQRMQQQQQKRGKK